MSTPGATSGEPGFARLMDELQRVRLEAGPSQFVDACRLLRYLDERQQAVPLAALRAKLRPIFCQSPLDEERFDIAFTNWIQPASDVTGRSDTEQDGGIPHSWFERFWHRFFPPRRRWQFGMLSTLALVLFIAVGMPRVVHPPKPNPASTAELTTSALAGYTAQASGARASVASVSHYLPMYRWNRELRPSLAWGAVAFPLLALVVLCLPAVLMAHGRSRQNGSHVELDTTLLRKAAQQVVPKLAGDIAAPLERHVRAEASTHAPLARRAPLHLRRTIEATLRSFGVPQLRYRHTKLRPSYLLLVDTEGESDPRGRLFYLWADRLRLEGLDVEIRLFRRTGDGVPVWVRADPESWREGWREGAVGSPLDRLDDPPVGQRLVVVSNGDAFADEEGNWADWMKSSRFYRWRERVLFTPNEPRDWGAREESIEQPERVADPGFIVLPLEEDALRAWAGLLASGELPDVLLADPQRYPRLLMDSSVDVLSDTPIAQVERLIAQLKLFLGDNGYQWLAACAVAPVMRWELTLLLGEAFFEMAGVRKETELRLVISRNYRRLARLPWMRAGHMPDWLRVRLLEELSKETQKRIREAVRELLAPLHPHAGGGVLLSIEPPPGKHTPRFKPDAKDGDTLYLGYMSGLTARQLVMRAPAKWQPWVRKLLAAQRADGWGLRDRLDGARDWIRAACARLAFHEGLAFKGPRRTIWLLAACFLLWLGALCALALARPAWLSDFWTTMLFAKAEHRVGYGHYGASVTRVAFSPDGKRVVTGASDGDVRIWNTADGNLSRELPPHDGQVSAVAFSPDGRIVASASYDGTVHLFNTTDGGFNNLLLDRGEAILGVAFNPAGTRLATLSLRGMVQIWDTSGSNAAKLSSLRISMFPFAAAFSPDGNELVVAGRFGISTVDVATGEVAHRWQSDIQAAAFDPAGEQLLTVAGGRAQLHDMLSLRPDDPSTPFMMRDPDSSVVAALSADGKALIASGQYVRLWDSRKESEGNASPAIGKGRLYDVTAGNPNTGASDSIRVRGAVTTAAFSPDGRYMVVGDGDQARLWGSDGRANSIAEGGITAIQESVRGFLRENQLGCSVVGLIYCALVAWTYTFTLRRRVRRLSAPAVAGTT
ncbi:hypothetical protein LMG28688_06490 [Paraburkholderia caffeinitolerans]|uniref:Uncharacterized protein n=1 Tax=Paraburkholderia caffeinitolerans TaxID=1723730 RepID=A0A6J5GXF6_9BURK|nr:MULTISPECIES: hypothetical protein [Paraburkholderia]CAB3807135.1 hypothetical protein LMG28688_06490 [Paraburkholderia caffeinitolerans]